MKILLHYRNGETKELELNFSSYDDAPGILVYEDYGFYCVGPRSKGTVVAYEQVRTLFVPPNGEPVQAAGVLEKMVSDILAHDNDHQDHGVGCACHDKTAGDLRGYLYTSEITHPSRRKSWGNLMTVLSYITSNPPLRN